VLFHAAAAAVFYPSAGVTLGALLITSRQRWGWVLAAAGVVEFGVDVWQGQGTAVAAGFAVANMIEPLLGAMVVGSLTPDRLRSGRLVLTRRADAARFLAGAAVAGPLAGTLIGASVIHWGLGRAWWDAVGPYWAGDALAVATLGAAITGFGHGRPWTRRDAAAAGLLVSATAGSTVVGFWSDHLGLAYLSLPVLVAAAFTGRVALVTGCGFVMAFVANMVSGAGHGPWARYLTAPHPAAALLQMYLAGAVLTAWALTVEITERDRARQASQRETTARHRVQALQVVTAGLARAATVEQIGTVLVEHGVALVARHGVVAVRDQEAGCWRTITTSGFPAQVAGRYAEIPFDQADRVPITYAAMTGQTLVLTSLHDITARFPDVTESHLLTSTVSLLVLPLRTREKVIGAVAFGFAEPGPPGPELTAVASTLADLTGQALERAELYEREYTIAHQLQRDLLPRIPDHLPGVTAGAAYRPARPGHEVGGDWYDVFELPGGRVGFAVGDVVGHDLRAAATMARLQILLRAVARTGTGPAAVLHALDEACDQIDGADCATVGYAEYTPADRCLRYACAGHPPPLLVAGNITEFLLEGRSPPLGIPAGPRAEADTRLASAAMLIWFSDGLIERRDSDLDHGLDRLAATAAALPGTLPLGKPQAWADALLDSLTSGHDSQHHGTEDDTVVACLHLHAPTDPPSDAPRQEPHRPDDVGSGDVASDDVGSDDVRAY
jgi:integral membrane sensor domain MASE1